MSAPHKTSILWLFTGVMALLFAAACGSALSGAATAVSAGVGVREEAIAAIAVVTLVVGFAAALVVGLRDLAGLARRDEPSLPLRWAVGSMAALCVAGPFWNLGVVHIQEPISGSDSVRIAFDNVLYGLVLTLAPPLALGVPLMLTRRRRLARLGPALGQA
ncbi:MAG TPA: hypothetical protein VM597_00855 [Gemmataceae bacterium]|jgi:cytosine/uracil/thiamine/allantoin permease|nr:hypothetical protein [Gemmataceae bacterium]